MKFKIFLQNFKNYLLNRYQLIKFNDIYNLDLNLIGCHNFKEIFENKSIEENYLKFEKELKAVNLPEFAGGINKGDRRGLFYLLKHFKPKNVLEIGTHIGSSTLVIAKALFNLNSEIETVDIIDVNDKKKENWKNLKFKNSPLDNLNILKISKNVKFINSNSIDHLNNTKIKYDFIFLDGSHKSEVVFQEIILSISKIRENGLILLHDYFDKGKTIWENKPILYGPYLALKKLLKKQ